MKYLQPGAAAAAESREVKFNAGEAELEGALEVPPGADGLVLFAHGSGSSRFSARNRRVAQQLQNRGLGTLLFDLLTKAEERADARDGHLRFDVGFLASRLQAATRWTQQQAGLAELPIGYFGASTGAAAALIAAAREPEFVTAVVSRGGRPDLAGSDLERVRAPTLLIVGGHDDAARPLNEAAFERLRGIKRMETVAGATHGFQEPGALDVVAELAGAWFHEHLIPPEHWQMENAPIP